MNLNRQEVYTRWLDSRAPSQRTGNEAQKFSDECWDTSLRLDASPHIHYELVMATIRRTLVN